MEPIACDQSALGHATRGERDHPMSSNPRLEHAQLLAMCQLPGVTGTRWSLVAREAQRPGGLERLLEGSISESSEEASTVRRSLRAKRGLAALDKHVQEVESLLTHLAADDIRLVTVLDDDYPVNLRLVYNLPPFLFYRGTLEASDARAVAVVGTRKPTRPALRRAAEMSRLLTAEGVTVLSGLARGIDTAAHEAALEASGRTVAVLGSGIRRIYPSENSDLASRIASNGAIVSQFWPDQPPTSYTFPRRNVVTSGMGQGTVVIEASATSGAKMQARLALEHGKHVFLISSLVRTHSWARAYLARGAVEVSGPTDIVRLLRSPEDMKERSRQVRQETLALS